MQEMLQGHLVELAQVNLRLEEIERERDKLLRAKGELTGAVKALQMLHNEQQRKAGEGSQ